MRLVFDLDGTLCQGSPYTEAYPVPGVAKFLSELKQQGHEIIIYTSRGDRSHDRILREIAPYTLEQLSRWRFEYDEIVFGKPEADLYIDDQAVSALNLHQIRKVVMELARVQLSSKKFEATLSHCESMIEGLSKGF